MILSLCPKQCVQGQDPVMAEQVKCGKYGAGQSAALPQVPYSPSQGFWLQALCLVVHNLCPSGDVPPSVGLLDELVGSLLADMLAVNHPLDGRGKALFDAASVRLHKVDQLLGKDFGDATNLLDAGFISGQATWTVSLKVWKTADLGISSIDVVLLELCKRFGMRGYVS